MTLGQSNRKYNCKSCNLFSELADSCSGFGSLRSPWPFMQFQDDHCNSRLLLVFRHWVVSNSFATPWTVTLQAPSDFGISQVRKLEWVAISSSRGPSQPRDQTCISCICRWILYHWATWEALQLQVSHPYSKKMRNQYQKICELSRKVLFGWNSITWLILATRRLQKNFTLLVSVTEGEKGPFCQPINSLPCPRRYFPQQFSHNSGAIWLIFQDVFE